MLIRPDGGESGIKDYLEKGQTRSRFFDRDQLDYRLILDGDIELLDSIVSNIENEGEKYHHFTLSFKEDNISEEILQKINDEFKEFISQGYAENEIYFYSEAHLPKIKSYTAKNGKLIERKPHIHAIVPRFNLLTGTPVEFTNSKLIRYYDAFQEYINQKYGLESPKDNARDFTKHSEIIGRHRDDLFDGHNKDVKQQILQKILENNVTSLSKFDELLRNEFKADVSYVKGKLQDYFQLKLPGSEKNIRLKDWVFSDNFISLNYDIKRDKIKEISTENIVYVNIGSDKKIDKKNLEILSEWRLSGALLQKHWNQFSKADKAKYAKMAVHEKLELLNTKRNNHYKKVEEQNVVIGRPNAGEYSRIIAKYVQSVASNIEAAADNIERAGGTEISATAARRRVREARGRNTRQMQKNRSRSGTDWTKPKFSSGAYKPRINQAVIDKLVCEMNDSDWVVHNNKQIEGVKKNLNATTVLELLAITHGVIPQKFKVEVGKDGLDRIVCGNRKYNVVDFLFKEINLNWNETKDMLSIAIKMQLDVDRERGYDPQAAKYLWAEYQEWFDEHKKVVEAELGKYKLDYKDLKENIRKWYTTEVSNLSVKYEGFFHKINQEKQKLKAEKIIRENNLKNSRMTEYQRLKSELNLKLQDAYREFLLQKANIEKDEVALRELRRLRLNFEEYEKQGSIRRTEVYYAHRLSIKFMIDKDGIINYLDGEMVFIKDTGHRIDVLYSNKDNIGFIVDLALKKYGTHVSLDGTNEFKRRFIEHCANNNINMTYKDKWSQRYLNEYKETLANNHAALIAAKALEKEQSSHNLSLSYKDVILAEVITIHGNNYQDGVENSVNVTLIDKNTNEVIKLSGAYLKPLDKLTRGALLDLEIDFNNNEAKTRCRTSVKDFNFLKTMNSKHSKPMPVISTDGTTIQCGFNLVGQIEVEQGNSLVLPEDKVVTRVVATDSGLQHKIIKVIDSEQKKQLINHIISEDCNQAAENLKREVGEGAKIYQISGKYINSGPGIDPFYKKESFYILLKTPDGKLKSMWGKELAKFTQQIKLEKSKIYAISKATGHGRLSISEVGLNMNQRIKESISHHTNRN